MFMWSNSTPMLPLTSPNASYEFKQIVKNCKHRMITMKNLDGSEVVVFLPICVNHILSIAPVQNLLIHKRISSVIDVIVLQYNFT